MARRRRLLDKGSHSKSGSVVVSLVNVKGWSLPQAADLIRQGYTDDHVQRATGFDIKIVRNYLGEK